MTFCPFCGVRADVDLRQIHFRDLGEDVSMACPQCTTPLGVIEVQTEPPTRIERCIGCHGMFFNPGEIESLLDSQTNPLVWLDSVQLQQIADDFGHQHEVVYQKCPMCEERMNHINFGRRSGVILDRCVQHGIWIEGSKLRRLTEWWRAGGRLIYQQNENHKAKLLYGSIPAAKISGRITPLEEPQSDTWSFPASGIDPTILIDTIVSVASMILED
jgi:Zn-finger nucleic acid-binding protein